MSTKKSLPIGTLIMVLIVALALLSVGYALWSETLTITGTVYTGEVDVEFSTYPEEECVDVNGIQVCPEPTEKELAAECTVEWLGPDADSNGDDGADQLVVNIVGMYPSWHCKVKFDVTNTGSVPVHVKWPVATTAIPEWVAADFSTCYQENVQLHQGDTTGICEIDIHFTNDQAPPEASGPITFGWEILAHQWNELPPPVVTDGYTTATQAASMRIKGYNSGAEYYLGPMNIPPSALPRVEANYNDFQTVTQKTYDITFAYDEVENKITSSISSPDAALEWDFDINGAPGCPVANWKVMDILIADSKTDSGVGLQNVVLGGYPLGNFAPPDGLPDALGTPGYKNWSVTGFDFSHSFLLTADMVVDGYIGNEAIKVQFTVGCLP